MTTTTTSPAVRTNKKAYSFGPATRKLKVTFEIALDFVPGWGQDIEDHINLIFNTDPYVLSAQVQQE